MGCFSSRKMYIEEKIEECEGYLKFSTRSISKIKQAFFQLNDGDIIKEKALRRAIINLDLEYSNNIASYVVFPFFQSFAIGIDSDQITEETSKKRAVFFDLDELLKKDIQSDIYDFNKIICVLFLMSNEKSSIKASELFKQFCGPNQLKMSKLQVEDCFVFIFQAVAFYSLIFSELSSKKIALFNSKIQENISAETEILIDWLFTDMGDDEITESYFVSRIRQYEAYLGYSIMSSRGIRRRVLSFVYMRYDEMEDYILKKAENTETKTNGGLEIQTQEKIEKLIGKTDLEQKENNEEKGELKEDNRGNEIPNQDGMELKNPLLVE